MGYPVIYEKTFLIFWGIMLGLSIITGGFFMLIFTLTAILVLLHHEYAHVKQCIKRGVKINTVSFTWFGGAVNADIKYAHDAVPIYSAGVINTGCYMLLFVGLLGTITYLGRNVWMGFNFANNPYLQLLNSLAVFGAIMFFTNILPITYHSKEYGLVSTDGWAAYRFIELRDELWNDGAHEALLYGDN